MTESPSAALRFPLYYLELAESLVRSRQGNVAQIYPRCGLSHDALQQAGATLSLAQFLALVAICYENLLPGEPRSIQLLRHLPITAHGMIGIAAMTSDTLDQALDIGLRYFPLSMPGFTVRRLRIGNEVHVIVQNCYDFGSPLTEIMTELIIGSFGKMLFFANTSRFSSDAITTPLRMRVELTHKTEEDLDSFNASYGDVKFGCPESKFIAPRLVLQQPLLTSNRNAHSALIATLEQQLHANAHYKPLTENVRQRLTHAFASGHALSAELLAYELGLSTRTLSRQLNAEGSSLPALTQAVRMARAELLLVSSNMPVAKVALQLGYTETAAFSRAFKQYSGKPPSGIRGSKNRR